MKCSIIGGGFGLYGYIPALSIRGDIVILPEKYRSTILNRAELLDHMPNITWKSSVDKALESANSVVIASLPELQPKIVSAILRDFPNIDNYILEKPLAPTPDEAQKMLIRLQQSGVTVNVGYVFTVSPWSNKLRKISSNSREIKIKWGFLAHHFKTNLKTWKSNHDRGGGPLRFYGIHLIAILAELGYTDVRSCELDCKGVHGFEHWGATFEGEGLATCEVEVDTNSGDSFFKIYRNQSLEIEMRSPFEDVPSYDSQDNRVWSLIKILNNAKRDNFNILNRVNTLWLETERVLRCKLF